MGAKKSRRRRKPGKSGGSGNSDQSATMPEMSPTAQPLILPTEGRRMATTYSPILDLPIEILNLIIEGFELQDLRNVCLVSRFFNAAGTPALYNTIALQPNTGPLHQIPQLLRSLMSSPELCDHVKTVIIGKAGRRDVPYPAKYSPYFPIPLGLINLSQAVELISQTGMSHQSCWIEHFKKGDAEAALTLLLTLLPNLKFLTIESDYNDSAPFLSLTIQEAFGSGKALNKAHVMFQALEMVSFARDAYSSSRTRPRWDDATALSVYGACSPVRTDWNNFSTLSFFYLPSLKEISVSINSYEEHNKHEFWPCGVPDLGGLEVLKVDQIRESTLGAVLTTCSKLKKLTWIIPYDSGARKSHSTGPIDRNQMVAALAVASETLTDLTFIPHDEGTTLFGGLGPTVGPLGSLGALRQFESIRTLTVTWLLLMGHDRSSSWGLADVLPRNLEHLIIKTESSFDKAPNSEFNLDEFTIYSAIRDWLLDWRAVTPRLKSFSITLWQISDGTWTAKIRRELKKLCRRVGVEYHNNESEWYEDSDAGWRVPAGWEW